LGRGRDQEREADDYFQEDFHFIITCAGVTCNDLSCAGLAWHGFILHNNTVFKRRDPSRPIHNSRVVGREEKS
jgi:hypothetical protein